MISESIRDQIAEVNAQMTRLFVARGTKAEKKREREVWVGLERLVNLVQTESVHRSGRGVVP